MSHKSGTFWLLILILIIAIFLRLYQIKTVPPGLYPDEAIGGNQGLEALQGGGFSAIGGPASGWKLFYPENNGRTGLFINLQGISAGLFGATSPWTLRFPSAIFGILTVLGVYFLGKELFSRRIGLLSAFFLATSFWHINFSRIGFDGIAAPFFLVWAVYFFLKALRPRDSKFCPATPREVATERLELARSRLSPNKDIGKFSSRGVRDPRQSNLITSLFGDWRDILNSIFSGILYGLGFHTYIAYRITPLLFFPIIIYYWKKSRDNTVFRKKILLSTFYFLLSTFLVALPLGIYFLKHPADFFGRTSEISVFSSATPLKDLGLNILKTLGMFNIRGDSNWRHNYDSQPELFWPVGIMFLIGIFVGVETLWQNLYFGYRSNPQRGFSLALPPAWTSSMRSRAGRPRSASQQDFEEALGGEKAWSFAKQKFFAESAGRSDSPEIGDGRFRKILLTGYHARSASEPRQNTNFALFILFLWFILAMLPVVISNEALPHALRSILMIPPVFILAGIGGIWLYEIISAKIQNYAKLPKFIIHTSLFIILSLFVFQAYYTYFILWASNRNTLDAFSSNYVALGEILNQLPREIPKYIVVQASGVPVNGIPMPAQTVMFITDTYSAENQQLRNIHYILPDKEKSVPAGAVKFYLE